MRGLRILLYCHNALGLGHLVRTGAIAAAIRRIDPSADVLVVTGAQITIPALFPNDVAYVKLPSARLCIENGQTVATAAHLSIPFDELRALRAALIKTVVTEFQPDACLVDHNPAGFYNELDLAITAYRELASNGRLVLGMRGIAYGGSDNEQYIQKYSSYLRSVYDGILVYVDPSVLDIGSYMPPDIAAKLVYTGYVTRFHALSRERSHVPNCRGSKTILLAAGSGSVGYSMMRRVLDSLGEGAEPDWRVVVCTGPYMENREADALDYQISQLPRLKGTRVHRVAHDAYDLLTSADVFIGQAGYNTLAEVMATRCHAVIIPYESLHGEQLAHASLLENRGLVTVIRQHELTASKLLSAVRKGIESRSQSDLSTVDLDGAVRAAEYLLNFARQGHRLAKGDITCERSI